MKTAEAWATQIGAKITKQDNYPLMTGEYRVIIRQIQLDAAKWGLEQASKVCEDNDECKDAILAFAKNLTIDQLPK